MAKIRLFLATLLLVVSLPSSAAGLSKELLLSSAWCTFSYNKTTGYSKSTKVRFHKDGTYRLGGNSEGYSSGSGGSMASQSQSSGGGKWKVTKGELYLSEGNGPLEHVPAVVKRNNNGYPIIVADGAEYSQCK